jgi:cellulose synthase operon protein YhjQ
MPLIVVTSFKGGAGKTTLAANLAVGLRSVGWDVLAVDFNPQDSLKLHFGLDAYEGRGFAAQMLSGGSWDDAVFDTEPGINVMPFGRVPAALSGSVSGLMAGDTDRVIAHLATLAKSRMVIVDAPSLPSAGAHRLAEAADVVIVTTPTDAGSYAALSMADAETFLAEDGILAKTLVVANQFDQHARLQRSVLALLNKTFGDKLAATIEHDEAVDEALASRRTVLIHDQTSKAARSLVALAIHVDRLCGSPNGVVD